MRYYVLYNPLAGNGHGALTGKNADFGGDTVHLDITEIDNYVGIFKELAGDDKIVICGGDGTLNNFINAIRNIEVKNDILYIACGSGNDFLNDLGIEKNGNPIKINDYIKNLPQISVNGKDYLFLNGIGYGIDGYCCEERDRLQQKNNKPVNYTLIALKGLLFAFKPRNATVYVDGKEYNYKKVWMVPTMLGRFFGGGMMIAPGQDRNNKDGSLTVTVAHDLSKFMIVYLFKTIFKGEHVKQKKYVAIHQGYDIKVVFDKPCALQVDGETVTNVKEYSVKANKLLNQTVKV